MAESDFRVPVRGGVWSLITGPDLQPEEAVGSLASRGGLQTSWVLGVGP